MRCNLHTNVEHTVCMKAEGKPGGLLIVSDYPGRDEDRTGRPMVGKTGGYLRAFVKERWDGPVAITNGLLCAPGDPKKLKPAHAIACRGYLAQTLREVKPTRVLAMGPWAYRGLLDRAPPPMTIRRGYAHLSNGVPVFLMMNPAAAIRNRFFRRWFESDLRWALTTDVPDTPWDSVMYEVRTEADALKAEEDLSEHDWITWDTETSGVIYDDYFEVLCAAVSPPDADYGWLWTQEALENPAALVPLKRIMENPKIGKSAWNTQYDLAATNCGLDITVHGPLMDARLMRKILFTDASGYLKDNTDSVGMGGHKHAAEQALVKARASITKERTANRKGSQALPGFLTRPMQGAIDYPELEPDRFAYGCIDKKILYPYCLISGTPVVLEDGSTRSIQEIVRNQQGVKVLSYGPKGIEPKRVTGWHQRRVPGQTWWRIRTAADSKMRSRGLIATPDHKVRTTEDWKSADEIEVGDEILIPELELSHQQLQAVMGTLLGDTTLAVAPAYRSDPINAPSAYLLGSHTEKSGMSSEKVRQLHPHLILGNLVEARDVVINGRPGCASAARKFRTNSLHQLCRFLPWFRGSSGRRRLYPEALDFLGAVGLAWWYMDDGSIQAGDETAVFYTQRYPESDRRNLVTWLGSVFGKAYSCSDGTTRLSKPASKKLFEQIAPYVFPKQRCKLAEEFRSVPYQNLSQGTEPATARVTVSERYDPPLGDSSRKLIAETRYCLSVEGNENFFTSFGLVHNCTLDTVSTTRLTALYLRRLKDIPAFSRTWKLLTQRAIRPVSRIEQNGMPIDKDAILNLSAHLGEVKREVEQRMAGYGKWNPDSYPNTAKFLYEELKLPHVKLTDGGAPSVDIEALQMLQGRHPVIEDLIYYRELAKMKGTFVDGLIVHIRSDGCIHPSLDIAGARSGRLSCSKPALHQIPRAQTEIGKMIKNCFAAPAGEQLVVLDLSQIELRVAAFLSRDPLMIDLYKSGADFHQKTAERIALKVWGIDPSDVVGRHRSFAKVVNFSTVYQSSPAGIAAQILAQTGHAISIQECEVIQTAVMGEFPVLQNWVAQQQRTAKRTGETWTEWLGNKARCRKLWQIADPDEEKRSHAGRVAVNHPVQGLASDVCLEALCSTDDLMQKESWPAKMIMTVHDSLIFRSEISFVPELIGKVSEVMTSHDLTPIPLVVDAQVGPAWGSMEDYAA
jgi:uracil-DNA glycosylase family 4